MRRIPVFFLFFFSLQSYSQHCPWDCSGMLLLKTEITATEFSSLYPVLVDKEKHIVVDTVYGTGKDSYDTCRVLFYDDFIKYRTGRIKTHYWYGYDTAYHFAKDLYLVRYNYCKFNRDGGDELFIRYNDPSGLPGTFRYIPVPAESGIHLHDHRLQMNRREYNGIIEKVQPQIIRAGRKDWGLTGDE